jgi:dTMP kinase
MFITFEGIDNSGKTTQARMLYNYFKRKGVNSLLIREPGGTKISERIRKILLDREHLEMIPLTEFLLFSASRTQLVSEVIKPNLKKNTYVICDRYYDSSTSYQGYGGRLNLKLIKEVNDFATGYLKPDITFLINIPPKTALARQRKRGKKLDRIESKKLAFYNKVYRGFLNIARKEPRRFIIIDGNKGKPQIHGEIVQVLNQKSKSKY